MNDQLILIIGPDGTGKTTQIKLLIDAYKKMGVNYEYRWLRFYHFFSLPILGFARICDLSEVKKLENGDKIGYHYFYRSKVISAIYPIFLFFDTLLALIFKIYLPLTFRKKIICDRFVYDTIVDIMISTSNHDFYKSIIGKLFLRVIPTNNRIFLLMCNEKSLKQRRNDIRSDKNIKQKILLYQILAKEFNFKMINANESITDVHDQILRNLNE